MRQAVPLVAFDGTQPLTVKFRPAASARARFGATYKVIVPMDGTSAAQPHDLAAGGYQLLTQLNANPTNEPLRKSAVTLSRTDLIDFQAGG